MKILIAVVSAHSRELFADTVRSTWASKVQGADLKFFRGRGATRDPKHDEVFLNCGDGYLELPDKVRSIIRWAYDHEYDFVMKLDDDVVLKPAQWLSSGFQNYDFTGCQDPKVVPGEIRTPWGFAYILSRRSMELLKDAVLPGESNSLWPGNYHNNDEAWVSTILYVNNIFLNDDQRYYLYRGPRPEAPLPRFSRGIRRVKPPNDGPREGTFAWCLYIDAGLHNMPAETLTNEFKRIYQENL